MVNRNGASISMLILVLKQHSDMSLLLLKLFRSFLSLFLCGLNGNKLYAIATTIRSTMLIIIRDHVDNPFDEGMIIKGYIRY